MFLNVICEWPLTINAKKKLSSKFITLKCFNITQWAVGTLEGFLVKQNCIRPRILLQMKLKKIQTTPCALYFQYGKHVNLCNNKHTF